MKMKLELLPNEIILDIFEYFSLIHLIQCFFNLNSRLNKLFSQQFHLDFRRTSKTNFDYICANYVSPFINQIISIHLSNADDTPQQMELFLARDNFQVCQFTHLQSISLSHLPSVEILDKIMIKCSYLPSLTHFSIHHSGIKMYESHTKRFFNQISKFPKLIYCYLDMFFETDFIYFPNESDVYTSLRHSTIQDIISSFSALNRLCQCAPHLRSLSVGFHGNNGAVGPLIPNLSITQLRIRLRCAKDNFEHLLGSMPILQSLTCDLCDMYINGNEWEEMIKKYLPKLKILHMKMKFPSGNNEDKETRLNEIVDSFRTTFWINEHQRFVRCYWNSPNKYYHSSSICLFTLPYMFDDFDDSTESRLTKSTCPYDDEYFRCDRVIDLYYKASSFTDSFRSRARFNNIQSLSLSFPLNEQFLSIVSNLDRLTSLFVYTREHQNLDNIQSELQLVLDRTCSLHSLGFGPWSPLNSHVPFKETTCASVRRLDLRGDEVFMSWNERPSFNEEQCIRLTRSPLGMQCRTLLIKVTTRRNILDLVNNMPNLQVLGVRCEDDDWPHRNWRRDNDEVIDWLHQQFPSTCTITRDIDRKSIIRIWIR